MDYNPGHDFKLSVVQISKGESMKPKTKPPIKDIIIFILLIANLALTGYFIYRFIDFKDNHYDHVEALNTKRFYRLERATRVPSPTIEEIQRKGAKCHETGTNQNGTMIHECK